MPNRKIKNINIDKFKQDVELNIKNMKTHDSLSDTVNEFNNILKTVFDKHAPLKNKTIIIRPPTPWNSEDIKGDKAMRRKLERRWRHTGLQIDLDNYKAFRNKFNAKLNLLRELHYAKLIDEIKMMNIECRILNGLELRNCILNVRYP